MLWLVRRPTLAFLIVALATLPAAPLAEAAAHSSDVRLPPPNDLTDALRRKDDVELERLAARLGPARLVSLLDEPAASTARGAHGDDDERLLRQATWRAVSLIDDGWSALPELAERLPRETMAPADAAHAIRQIVETMPARLWGRELPTDLARRSERLLSQSLVSVSLPEARVDIVYALAGLGRLAPLDVTTIAHVLDDAHEDAAVRRAAAEALATDGTFAVNVDLQHKAEGALLSSIEHAPEPAVASAAAAVICRANAHPSRSALQQVRIRQLAADDTIALVDRLDLVGCLKSNDPLDKKLLDDLAAHGPDALRRRARAVGGR